MANKPYILSLFSLGPTVRPLSKLLGLKRSYEPLHYAPVIRWGNSREEYIDDTEYNNPVMIATVSNKGQFSRKMAEKGISHLTLFSGVPEKFPVVVRQTLSGTRGAGIVVCKNMQEYMQTPGNRFWTQWRTFHTEFGVHMLGGKVEKIFKKVRAEERPEEEFPIRNAHRGYDYSTVGIEKLPMLVKFMEDIYTKFPLEFGRWDIGYTKGQGYTVIEANSAPGLAENENTLNLYAQFFKKILGRKE